MNYFFLLDANLQATNKNNNREFKAGKSYELDEMIGNAFVKRGAARVEKQNKAAQVEAKQSESKDNGT